MTTSQPNTGRKALRYVTEIPMGEDYRPITLIKSHSDELSMETCELLTAMAPEPLVIHEIDLPIREHLHRGTVRTREDKFEALVEDWAEIDRRVYNSMRWLVQHHSGALDKSHRIILIPYGNPIIQSLVMDGFRGYVGREPELLMLVEHNGRLIPNPKRPLIDPGVMYYNGRGKLRQITWENKLPGWASMGKDLTEIKPKQTAPA